MMAELLGGVAFAAAAWLGALLARALCAGQAPFEDGPPAVAIRPWVVAFAGACVGVGVVAHHPSLIQLATIGFVVAALAAVTVSDFALGVIPDPFTLIPLAVLILAAAVQHNYGPLFSAVAVALPFAVAAWLSRGHGMGWGDVKLAALGGALLGPQEALLAFMLASAVAFAASRFSAPRGRPIAFAPYIAGGIGAMLVFGSRF
jgi:prepilin signal peptidase PulO-like enzyme (type II secretory pathway)